MSEPVIAAKRPCPVEVKNGEEYWWCSCGQSKTQPFCDGSHKGTGFSPMQYVAAADDTVYFCACKHSAKQPLCDGAHKNL